MKALVTASLDIKTREQLGRHMELHIEDWHETRTIYFEPAPLIERLRACGATALIVEADMIGGEVMDACGLELIGVCRGTPVNVDLAAATQRGIPVFHTPGRNADAVADLTLCFFLMLARNVWPAVSWVKGERAAIDNASDFLTMYQAMTGIELWSRTVGLIGLGAIGQRVARRVLAFGARVVAHDPFAPDEVFAQCNVERVPLDDLLGHSDFVSLHVPDVPETKGLLGAREIGLLKHGCYFVNTARAASVDEDALYLALTSGQITAAAFDVFWKEPVSADDRFVRLRNVIGTPHLGGATHDVPLHQGQILCASIDAWIGGRRPPVIANPEVLLTSGRS